MDTYEKKYSEALERAREYLNPVYPIADATLVQQIFPELRESEDERVRMELIEYLRGDLDDITTDDTDRWINWIEKQKDCILVPKSHLDPIGKLGVDGMKILEKQKEQKPASTEDMPYITDEHFFEREPADSFKYKLAEYMTKCCTKKEGPYGYEYGISAESILKMAEEELIKRGELKEPNLTATINGEPIPTENQSVDIPLAEWSDYKDKIDIPYCSSEPEWSEEDEKIRRNLMSLLANMRGDRITEETYQKYYPWLKSLRPSWKPSKEQLNALNFAITYFMHETNYKNPTELRDLYEQLKNL